MCKSSGVFGKLQLSACNKIQGLLHTLLACAGDNYNREHGQSQRTGAMAGTEAEEEAKAEAEVVAEGGSGKMIWNKWL
jgi:hypothetical protein